MLLLRGELSPQYKFVMPGAALLRVRLIILLFFSLSLTPATLAQAQSSPLTLAEAGDLALQREPGQASFLAHAKALEEQAVAAGQLPDPTLRMGLANYPVEAGGFSTEGMTQIQLGVRQSFPPGKTRAFGTRQFLSQANEMTRNADARARDVLTAVRSDWLDAYYWDHAYSMVSESRRYLEDLVAVTQSLYAVGKKDQQDVLRADLELSRLDDRISDIKEQRARARASLYRWIGTDSNRPLAEHLPSWGQVPELGTLKDELENHPALQAADARIAARIAGIDLARERYKPGWALDLGYGYRDGVMPNGSPRSDFVSLSVSVDLPVFSKNRQDRTLAAALSQRRAAVASKEQLSRELASRLEEEYSRWLVLSERVDLYEQLILTQAEDRANAALAAYQSGAGDFADVMRGFIDELNTRLDHIRLQTRRHQSFAVLANLGGFSQ